MQATCLGCRLNIHLNIVIYPYGFCRDNKSYEDKNYSLRNIREERLDREKIMRQQEKEYQQALALDKVKDSDKYENINIVLQYLIVHTILSGLMQMCQQN